MSILMTQFRRAERILRELLDDKMKINHEEKDNR